MERYELVRRRVTKRIASLIINPEYIRDSFPVINEWVRSITRGEVSAQLTSGELSFSTIVENSEFEAYKQGDTIFIQEEGYQYFIELLY